MAPTIFFKLSAYIFLITLDVALAPIALYLTVYATFEASFLCFHGQIYFDFFKIP